MADRQVTCVTTEGPKSDCTCITHIGRFSDLGGRITRAEGVRRIKEAIDRFYVIDPSDSSRVWVKVARRGNLEYLRTQPNDTERDNLLSLPAC